MSHISLGAGDLVALVRQASGLSLPTDGIVLRETRSKTLMTAFPPRGAGLLACALLTVATPSLNPLTPTYSLNSLTATSAPSAPAPGSIPSR